MRRTTIVCKCGELADIVDKTIAPHKKNGQFCERSGERYVPSPRRSSPESGEGPHGGELHYLGALEIPCPACHEHPAIGLELYAEKLQAPKDYPEWTGPITSPVGGAN